MIEISGKTRICAVIGNPVEHSLSPVLHNAAFRAKGLDYAYVAFQVDDIEKAISGIRMLRNLVGLSVTIPHKVSIIAHLDELDELAAATGSVNTVIRQGQKLKGYTTDGEAVVKALEDKGVTNLDRGVLVLGSGGAARAISFALAMRTRPGTIKILGVIKDEIDSLVKDVVGKTGINVSGDLLGNVDLKTVIPEVDLIMHCTPIGMHPKIDDTILTKEHLESRPVVFDIVYNPLQTKLLKEAKSAGCQVIPGIEMFVNQAVRQFELWTGETAPVGIMRKVVEENLLEKVRKK